MYGPKFEVTYRVFGCVVEKIDFGRIDFVKLILVKSELNVK